jgi:chromosome segregation ATPase
LLELQRSEVFQKLRADYEASTQKQEESTRTLADLQTKLRLCNENSVSLQAKLQSCTNNLTQLRQDTNAEIASKQLELSTLTSTMASLTEKLESNARLHADAMEKIQQSLNEQTSNTQSCDHELQSKNATIAQLELNAASLTSRIEWLENSNAILAGKQVYFQRLEEQMIQEKNIALQTSQNLEDTEKQLKEIKWNNTLCETAKTRLQSQLDQCKQEKSNLQRKLLELQEELRKAQDVNNALKQERDTLSEKLRVGLEANAAFQVENNNLEARINESNGQVRKLSEERASIQETLDQCTEAFKKCREAYENLTLEKDELQNRLATNDQTYHGFFTELENLRVKLASTKANNEDLVVAFNSLKAEKDSLQEQLDSLKEEDEEFYDSSDEL